nr:MAG TPA: helix-turn-helix XRE-family like protein [Caudoviricetes sp.]
MQIDVPGMLSRIELRMAELNMSKQSFYEKSGISSASFSQWNTGAYKPSVKKIKSAAKVLDTSVEYLLTGAGPGDIKKERPAENGEALEKDLPEDIQQLLSICRQNPALASALLSVARQIENGPAGPGSGGKE